MGRLTFRNYGGSYQLRISDPGDLEHVATLPEALWAVTSVPVEVLSGDPACLAFLDSDGDGRLRVDEFRAGLAWLLRVHGNRARLAAHSETLCLADINRDDPDGAQLHASALRLLERLGADREEIDLARVRGLQARIAASDFNGDGVVPPAVAGDRQLAAFLEDVIKTVGPVPDAGGRPGVDRSRLALFMAQARAWLDWSAAGEDAAVLPFGAATAAACAPVERLAAKIDLFFLQCDLVAYDERAGAEMKLRAGELAALDYGDSAGLRARLAAAPLAPPTAERVLYFAAVTSPAQRADLAELARVTLPLVPGPDGGGDDRLDEARWARVRQACAPYRDWLARRPDTAVGRLGVERLRACLDGPWPAQAEALIGRDLEVAADIARIRDLEKLILFQRWFFTLATNFVNLADLYDPASCSLYEAGRLVIEGREMTFTVRVRDRAAHRRVAAASHICLLYVAVAGGGGRGPFEVAVPVTSGDFGGLRVGRRGVFIAADQQVRDAEIVDIIANPVSIAEFVKSPFRQIGAFVGRQVEKFGRSGEERLEQNLAAPGGAQSGLRDVMVGGGIAIAALGSSLAYVTRALAQVRPGQVLTVLGGIAFLLFVPMLVLGLFRMWQRDLGLVLEAVGCALNVRIRITRAMGLVFTHAPVPPRGSRHETRDVMTRVAGRFRSAAGRCRPAFRLALLLALLAVALVLLYRGW